MLSQLSYDPILTTPAGLEPATSAVTGRRSNQLSHEAIRIASIEDVVPSKLHTDFRVSFLGQAFDRLVTVSSMHYCTSTSALSTLYSSRGLISLKEGISHLEGGFTLRCLQRLSLPNLATLPCRWSTTDPPVVRPSRSSRTKDSSSQISSARAG